MSVVIWAKLCARESGSTIKDKETGFASGRSGVHNVLSSWEMRSLYKERQFIHSDLEKSWYMMCRIEASEPYNRA